MLCQDSGHRTLQVFSGIVVTFIAFGLPVFFGWVLVGAARSYQEEFAVPNREVAKRLAKQMDADADVAAYVIRDITIGRDYSFRKLASNLPCL